MRIATTPKQDTKSFSLPLSIVLCIAAIGLWLLALWQSDLSALNEFGLNAVLPVSYYLALALLTISFLLALRKRVNGGLHVLQLMLLITLIHATPTLLYDELRYSWAWKHVGIVDYILRHGQVDTTIGGLSSVYHNWPGFFALSSLLSQNLTLSDPLNLARWGTLFMNLCFLLALIYLYRSSLQNTRLLWLSCWLFFSANWVGQDYFAPQALAFGLYLILLALCLKYFGSPNSIFVLPDAHSEPVQRQQGSGLRPLAYVIALIIFSAIVATHQITPVVIIAALLLLLFFRQQQTWSLPILFGLIFMAWVLFVATDYSREILPQYLSSLGRLGDNVSSNLTDLSAASTGQRVAAYAGRFVTASIWGLALLGIISSLRRSQNIAYIILALTPFILIIDAYGGEVLFRVYLFSLPFMAVFAAAMLLKALNSKWTILSYASYGYLFLLLVGFLGTYYGKEEMFYFSQYEAAASNYVHQLAPQNTLIIEGTRNYPSRHQRYEHFTYVALSFEPEEVQETVMRNPVAEMTSWLSDERYDDAYIIITRSQKAEVNNLGNFRGRFSLEAFESALLESGVFSIVLQNDDALILSLAKDRDP